MRFPFTDVSGSKIRPAVVLITHKKDITVCFITSEVKWKEEYDIILEPNQRNGLKTRSLVRIRKITTLDFSLIPGILGSLDENQIKMLNQALIQILDL